MLVLTRKTQEKIQIGDNITITILRVKGQAVRVGVDAPRDVRVIRSELPAHDGAATDAADRPAPASQAEAAQRAPLARLMSALHAG